MTYKEIKTMVASFGLSYAYHHFPDTNQAPPYVVFYYSGSDDFLADDKNYQEIVELVIELYTEEKDFTSEATIKSKLTESGLVYTWDEGYMDSERLHRTTYYMEVLITNEQS